MLNATSARKRVSSSLSDNAGSSDDCKRRQVEDLGANLTEDNRAEVRIGAAYYLEDLDLPGIADSMRMSERTVSRRLSSFRSRLRALLEGRPPVAKEETDGV